MKSPNTGKTSELTSGRLTRNRPRGISLICENSTSAASSSLRMRRLRSRNIMPSAVSVMLRVLRCNNLTRSRASSRAIFLPTAEAEIPSRRPASTKLRLSATCTKTARLLKFSMNTSIADIRVRIQAKFTLLFPYSVINYCGDLLHRIKGITMSTMLSSEQNRPQSRVIHPHLISAVIDQALADHRLVGTVVRVSHRGTLRYHRAAGWADREARTPMTSETLFRLASVSKPIVSAAAMVLVAQGKLSLDDDIRRWLTDFAPRLSNGETPRITLRQLLSHTAGLSYRFLEIGR